MFINGPFKSSGCQRLMDMLFKLVAVDPVRTTLHPPSEKRHLNYAIRCPEEIPDAPDYERFHKALGRYSQKGLVKDQQKISSS